MNYEEYKERMKKEIEEMNKMLDKAIEDYNNYRKEIENENDWC